MPELGSALDWLDRLIAVDTTPGNGNAQIVDMILQRTALNDVRTIRVASPLGDADGLILSAGPETPNGLVLSGHLDVVPVTGQDWQSDPFRLRWNGETLYGRGTCDMKGFVACALATLEAHLKTRPHTPLHLVLSADEETTCRSIETLVRTLKSQLPPVRGVLVGEPTMMIPANRHKASATHHVAITGQAIHASLAHQGVNAVTIAARLIAWLSDATERSAAQPETAGFDPDHDLHTATRIAGGTAINTVADTCCFDWDMRLMPGHTMADVTDAFDTFSATLTDGRAQITRTCTAYFPDLKPGVRTPFADAVLKACDLGDFTTVPYGTEAGFFQAAGFDTLVCGPGDPRVAHLTNECVEVSQLAACLECIWQIRSA